jgi:hypothetical protein
MVLLQMDQNQILTVVAASVPTMITVLIGILINNSRLGDMNSRMNSLESSLNRRIDDLRGHMDSRFDHMDRQFDEKLRRVEEVLDARLRHLDER